MTSRVSRRLLAVSLLLTTAACTALLGDFEVSLNGADGGIDGASSGSDGTTDEDGSNRSDTGGPTNDATSDAPVDAPIDALPDGGPDGGPPPPDGGFVSVYSFGSQNGSPPGSMRVAYDKDGNLFVLFGFSISNNDVLDASVSPVGSLDIGLLKISPSGQRLWVKSYGSAAFDSPGGLAVDANGDAYISGTTEGSTIDFGGTAGTLTRACNGGGCSGRYIGWITKIDGTNGNAVKAIQIDTATLGGVTTSNQGAGCNALVARGNKIAAACTSYGDFSFPIGGVATTIQAVGGGTGGTAGYALFDTNLNASWANLLGTAAFDTGMNVAIAANGDVVFIGQYYGASASNLVDSKNTISQAAPAQQNSFLGRLAANSGNAIWAKVFGSGGPVFNGVGIDSMDRIAVIGTTQADVAFGSHDASALGGNGDILIATFTGNDGTPLDVRLYGGNQYDVGSALAIDRWDSLATAASYRSSGVVVGNKPVPDPLTNATSGYVARSGPSLDPFWVGGFTTALQGTFLQAWSVTTDPSSGRVAAAGVFQGVVNFGNNDPIRSANDGGTYNVWVVVRNP